MNFPILSQHQTDLLNAFVAKQKIGAQFVISAPLLSMDVSAFDALANYWLEEGSSESGFSLVGIPFRKVIDGEFLIQRVTALRVASELDE